LFGEMFAGMDRTPRDLEVVLLGQQPPIIQEQLRAPAFRVGVE
jgi:hypothetical protein